MDFATQIRNAVDGMVRDAVQRATASYEKRIFTLELELSVLKGLSAYQPLVPTFHVQLREPIAGSGNILHTVKAIRDAVPSTGLRDAKGIADFGGKIGPMTRNVANELYYKLTSLGRSCTIEER